MYQQLRNQAQGELRALNAELQQKQQTYNVARQQYTGIAYLKGSMETVSPAYSLTTVSHKGYAHLHGF